MSEFELVTIALSFIVGFGVTAILAGLAALLTRPGAPGWDWLPLAWAMLIFAELVMFWFGALFVERSIALGLATFWSLVLLASLLFIAGALVLPSNEYRLELTLAEDFARFGRRALVPIAAYQSGAAVTNVVAGMAVLDPGVYLNVVLAILALVVFLARRRVVRRFVTLIYGAILAYGMVFVWARPGAMDRVVPG